MERLTHKVGNDYISTKIDYQKLLNINDNEWKNFLDVIERLGKLEDLEEQIGMPLDVFLDIILNQRKIYCIIFDDEIDEYEVDTVLCNSFDDIRLQDGEVGDCGVSTLGYLDSWFLTREEAERKLEEINNE